MKTGDFGGVGPPVYVLYRSKCPGLRYWWKLTMKALQRMLYLLERLCCSGLVHVASPNFVCFADFLSRTGL